MNHDLMADALRASACGLHACETAVALVIDHRYWLTRADFLTGFVDTFPSLTDGSPMAVICWPEAIAALDRGQLPASSSLSELASGLLICGDATSLWLAAAR
jgi:hypothetical protein